MQTLRKLRKINEVLRYIKSFDADTAVTRFMIEQLIHDDSVYHITTGKQILVDLDEVLNKIGLTY